MPEGDTVWHACRQLHAALAGSRLVRGELRVPALGDVDLAGDTVTEVVARGKHQLIRLGSGRTVHTHLRLDGAWRFVRAGQRWPGPDHEIRVVLGTERGVALGMRLPVVELIATADEGDAVGHLGPDLLGSDWDADEALRRLRREPERGIGEALLDQRVLAGLGTFWRAELLFLRGVDPRTPVGEVAELERLIELAHQLLAAAARSGQQNTTGSPRAGERSYVFERTGQPCRRCRTPIEFAAIGPQGRARNAYWCPTCQWLRVDKGA